MLIKAPELKVDSRQYLGTRTCRKLGLTHQATTTYEKTKCPVLIQLVSYGVGEISPMPIRFNVVSVFLHLNPSLLYGSECKEVTQ
jgi:hypothetical protein